MNAVIHHRDFIAEQISSIAMALPNDQAREFLSLPDLQRTHADWLILRAQLYQALALQSCESVARQQLLPLDEMLNARFHKPKEDHRLRWRWSFISN